MIQVPPWQASLYKASIGVASLLDEIISHSYGYDEDDELYRHAEDLQLHITRLERILYEEKTNGI